MPAFTLADMAQLAQGLPAAAQPTPQSRLISIWEITQWILPMAPEHLRRVLAAHPDLPQGQSGTEGGTRWFTPRDIATLRHHFASGPRKSRYQPQHPPGSPAPLITLTAPQGRAGRSTAALHLATAAALAGHKVLLIDADPAGCLADALQVGDRAPFGILSLIARDAARHLRQANEARLDRGEAALAMDAVQAASLDLTATALIRPTLWPGLDLIPAGLGLMQGDVQIARWRMAQPRWQPWHALAQGLAGDDICSRYDLILCDTGRGLGPLALAALTSADVLLAPLPMCGQAAGPDLAAGLAAVAQALGMVQAEAETTAQALGQTAPPMQWRRLAVLATRAAMQGAGGAAAARAAGLAAALAPVLLPAALPEIAQIAEGSAAQFYDLDYRAVGRLAYAPQRDATEAAWRGLAGLLAEIAAAPT